MIEEGAARALADLHAVAPYNPGKPCQIEVEFATADAAAPYARKSGVELLDPCRLVSGARDWWTAWRQFYL